MTAARRMQVCLTLCGGFLPVSAAQHHKAVAMQAGQLRRMHQEEEHRLVYVAMTRAKDHLCLTSLGQAYRNGTPETLRSAAFFKKLQACRDLCRVCVR